MVTSSVSEQICYAILLVGNFSLLLSCSKWSQLCENEYLLENKVAPLVDYIQLIISNPY